MIKYKNPEEIRTYMKKVYNKLIRDKIPEIIEKDGATYKTRILDEKDFKTELLKKLIEEAQEVVGAKDDHKELIKELGDILEVIDYLVISFDLNKSEIERVKAERRNSRGGFDKKLLLEYTEK